MLQGQYREVDAGMDVEFGVDVFEVCVDRMRRQVQVIGDTPVRQSPGYQLGDPKLGVCERPPRI